METEKYLPNEMQFILDCMRRFILTGENGNAASLPADAFTAENLNWQQVLELAHRHRVIPLVRLALPQFDIGYPDFFLEQLKSRHENIARKGLEQTAELQRLVTAFQNPGIDFIVLKSVPLAQELYSGIANRPSHDIDLLIQSGDTSSAFSCMHDLGYSTNIDQEALIKRNLMARLRRFSGKDISFFSTNRHMQIELHWRLTDTYSCFPVPVKKLLGHKRTIKVAGIEIPVMPREEMVLYLCSHGAIHGWFRLHWLCDIALLFRRHDIDWQWVAAEAKRLGTMPSLGMAVVLIRDLLKTPAPAPVAENKMITAAGLKLAPKALPRIFNERKAIAGQDVQSILRQLQIQSGFRNRIAILLRLLCPNDRDRDFFRLPDSLAGLYFILHPLRLAYQIITAPRR